ncbi:MAG TPA: helix-turn-helix domain-containing protein [Bauldia sp.]|nr:helix-turn-helix domain-containing protein [Bauldia sp.]
MTAASCDDVEARDESGEGHVLLRHPVPPALTGLVARITGYRETLRRPIRMTETASLIVPVILSFGEPFEIALGREPEADDRYGSFTAGLTDGPVRIRSSGASHCLQIDFTPLGAHRYFDRPMHELTGRMVPLDDLEDPTLRDLRERLGEARSWSRRFVLAVDAVSRRLAESPAPAPATAWAYDRIVATGGAVRVAAIAERLDWSRKHLAARFREEVGMSPKTIARIARFNRAQAMAASGEAGGWAEVAAACGYADQAHLVREFAEFAGATPGAWRAPR